MNVADEEMFRDIEEHINIIPAGKKYYA